MIAESGPCVAQGEVLGIVVAIFSFTTTCATMYLTHERWKQKRTRDMRLEDRLKGLSEAEKSRALNVILGKRERGVRSQ